MQMRCSGEMNWLAPLSLEYTSNISRVHSLQDDIIASARIRICRQSASGLISESHQD